MKVRITLLTLFFLQIIFSQTNPAITGWLQNTTGITGRHYVNGNPTPIVDVLEANVQNVQYSNNWVYAATHGVPAYITGPFANTTIFYVGDQNAVYKFPLNPTQNTGVLSPTTGGNIGVFINGVSLFDFRDGVAWNNTTQSLCGGPGNTACPGGPAGNQAWNRDAVVAELNGFDCAKAHPANGNYHHHQNPTAFNLDLAVLRTICDTYPSDGLYVINPSQHAPLIGFAFDGFPIYGAYGYANTNGTGDIVRIKSSYQLKNQTTRANGPDVSTTYFNGYFREDYEYIAHPNDPSYLDEHNGRICVTPEYPNGIYCYFATIDANYNSTYPYVIGPTFYGNKTGGKATSITETTSTYTLANSSFDINNINIKIYPNPAQDFIAIQSELFQENLNVELVNELGQVVKTSAISQGSTLAVIETDTLYNGIYFVRIFNNKDSKSFKVIINK